MATVVFHVGLVTGNYGMLVHLLSFPGGAGGAQRASRLHGMTVQDLGCELLAPWLRGSVGIDVS